MSFTYESFLLSGYNSGSATISGIQKDTPLYWIVSGLKYNSNPVTYLDYFWFTGVTIAGSGTLPQETGGLGWNDDFDAWVGILTFTGVGEDATGCIELNWNSGVSYNQGASLTKGFLIYANKNSEAWDIITSTNGSVDNADEQHSHAGAASHLYDLDDVFLPSTINDNDLLVYSTESGGWTTGVAPTTIDPTGYETVSGSWIAASGDLDDYKYVSGRYALTSGSYNTLSGAWVSASGDLDDYKYVSGRYALTSGSYNLLSGAWVSASGDLDDYKYVSGRYALTSGSYNTLSGSYSTLSGTVKDYAYVSGRYALTSGSYNTTSGVVAQLSGANLTAFHNNINGEIQALGGVAPAAGDLFVIEDASDSFSKKSVSYAGIEFYLPVSGDYKLLSGNYKIVSGSYNTLSGSYVLLSGNYALTSGSYNTHIANTNAHHTSFTELSQDASPQLGGDLDLNLHNIVIEKSLTASDHTYEGVCYNYTNTVPFGSGVYLTSSYTVAVANTGSVATMRAIGISVGTNKVLVLGIVRDDSWNFVTSGAVYIGANGSPTTTIPATAGNVVQVIGIALTPDVLHVQPSLNWVIRQ